jgi:hypothetical protein
MRATPCYLRPDVLDGGVPFPQAAVKDAHEEGDLYPSHQQKDDDATWANSGVCARVARASLESHRKC